jgi:hypothetical protein
VFPTPTRSRRLFQDFARIVTLLRTTAIEGDSNKRWTSKFAFPYGPAALFPDLGRRKRERRRSSMDRRFFARTGELAYVMLCRSGRGPALYEHLQRSVFDPRPRGTASSSASSPACRYERKDMRTRATSPTPTSMTTSASPTTCSPSST